MEQRSPIWPFLKLNSPCNCSANRFFLDSNDLKIKLCKCDRVGMIKSTTNRHMELFVRAVVWLWDMIAHQPIQVTKWISLNKPKKFCLWAKFLCSDCISIRIVVSSSPRSRFAGFVFQCDLCEFVLKTEQTFLAVDSTPAVETYNLA